jgi:glycosyltransferase involved in cell wall biosynthesis
VIHVPYWASPLFPPAPTVVTVHDLIPLLLPAYGGGVVGRLYTRLVALSARRAARVLTDSQASRQDIVRYLKLDPGRVQTVYLAAHDRYQPLSDPQELTRVGHKYDLSPRYLLYLGGFDVRKNVINILRAWARLAHSSTSPPSEARLVVAGQLPSQDSTFAPDPRRAARELGVAEQVQFTGWVDEEDKPALYSGAVAFLFPSHYEGFGLPPLEAMSCGTPAIVSGRGSLPEVVGEAGLCVDPDDVDALAWAVRQILEDAALRERLSQAALTQAASFCWGRTAQETLAAYLAAAR